MEIPVTRISGIFTIQNGNGSSAKICWSDLIRHIKEKGFWYFTKTLGCRLWRSITLFQGLTKAFEFARNRAIQNLVANPNDEPAQDGWIHPEGDLFGAG